MKSIVPQTLRSFIAASSLSISTALLLAAGPLMGLAAPGAGPGVVLKPIAEGFVSPLNAVALTDGSGQMLIGDQIGTIHLLKKDGSLAGELVADLRPRMATLKESFDERGLLGMVLHPRYSENGRVFVCYSAPLRSSAPTNFDSTLHLSEFRLKPGGTTFDMGSERVLLAIDKPQFNHNGGRMAFGPDGYLYLGVGDGGQGNDEGVGHPPEGNGQATSTLLGKILRIDVDAGNPYGVPKDNPFVGNAAFRPEIYAYGIRNPWGVSFDRGGARELFVADVGQGLFEEVNIVAKGGNYGWRVREGFAGFNPKDANKSLADAPTKDARGVPFMEPAIVYKHPSRGKLDPSAVVGISITGGYVYRGTALPHLVGKYIFGDWSRNWALPDGVLFVATRPADGKGPWAVSFLDVKFPGNRLGGYITAFGEDNEGEIYVMTNGRNSPAGKTGKLYKLVAE